MRSHRRFHKEDQNKNKEEQLSGGVGFNVKMQVWSLFWWLNSEVTLQTQAPCQALPFFFQMCWRNLFFLSLCLPATSLPGDKYSIAIAINTLPYWMLYFLAAVGALHLGGKRQRKLVLFKKTTFELIPLKHCVSQYIKECFHQSKKQQANVISLSLKVP